MTMTMRHMYMYTSLDGHTCSHFSRPPRAVRKSFESNEGVTQSVTQYTVSGEIKTAWTNVLICDDYVWVRGTHPYQSDEPMFANGCAARLARRVALEVEASMPDAMMKITGAGHI